MPHKHRRKGPLDTEKFNLPPERTARPLSTHQPKKSSSSSTSKKTSQPEEKVSNKRKNRKKGVKDDTPKAFARLMQFQAKGRLPNGLDDGRRSKKRKRGAEEEERDVVATLVPEERTVPRILPGERLADYGARVDQALPVAGLTRKAPKAANIPGLKHRQTKTERKMNRMQSLWREEDRRRKEKLEELEEQRQDEELEKGMTVHQLQERHPRGKRGSKGRPGAGEPADDDDDDPWSRIAAAKHQRPTSLHDVVQAPPQLTTIPKEKFKIRNGSVVQIKEQAS